MSSRAALEQKRRQCLVQHGSDGIVRLVVRSEDDRNSTRVRFLCRLTGSCRTNSFRCSLFAQKSDLRGSIYRRAKTGRYVIAQKQRTRSASAFPARLSTDFLGGVSEWRRNFAEVWGTFLLVVVTAGGDVGDLKIIASIKNCEVIQRILRHLQRKAEFALTAAARAPPVSAADRID